MQNYMKDNDIAFKEKRMLISGMEAKEVLLASDLIKWYLKNDLEVTAVHQVIEFVPSKPFAQLVPEVVGMRRAADLDPSRQVWSDIAKLIG